MTKKDALTIALTTLTNDTYTNPNWTETSPDTIRKEIPVTEIRDTLIKMIDQLNNHHKNQSEEVKERQNAKRKEKTANARAALIEQVAPVLREGLKEDTTVKDLFAAVQDRLPADFTPAKVQNILYREMASEIIKTERKGGKPNLYRLANIENDDPNQYLPREIAV